MILPALAEAKSRFRVLLQKTIRFSQRKNHNQPSTLQVTLNKLYGNTSAYSNKCI